jgi:hypothetical protein
METFKKEGKTWVRFRTQLEFSSLICQYFVGAGIEWDEAVNQFVKALNSQGIFIANLASVM